MDPHKERDSIDVTIENSIIKEEIIIPDITEEEIYLNTSCSQIPLEKGPMKITSVQYNNLSVLNSEGNTQVLKIPLSKVIEKEVVEMDIEEEIAHSIGEEAFYHAVCLTCRKLRNFNDVFRRCKDCLSIFHYECLRCRDVLSSIQEYYNHLKVEEFCSKIDVPLPLKNDSYALATRMEKNQFSEDAWERAQKFISIINEARIQHGELRRIKLCCPVCGVSHSTKNGHFWCMKCDSSSVFKCQTCDKNYSTYNGALCHKEDQIEEQMLYECNDCSFKDKRKQSLIAHIHDKHDKLKRPYKERQQKIIFQCPDCSLIISSPYYLEKHIYSCREKYYFKCMSCSKKFLGIEEVTSHLQVAHQMTDSEIRDLVIKIENDRNKQEEKNKQRKQRIKVHNKIENNIKPRVRRSIIPYCLVCHKLYDYLKKNVDHDCPKCKSPMGVQCKFCKKNFKNYNTAYYHIRKKCKKIGIIASNVEKIDGPVKKIQITSKRGRKPLAHVKHEFEVMRRQNNGQNVIHECSG